MMRRIRTSTWCALALALGTFALFGVTSARASGDAGKLPVSVIGVDGAAWRVIDPMLARGELPTFEKLIARGVRGKLRSELPLRSPAIWTTVATGVNRKKHGIELFGNEQGVFISSRDRRVPALWTIASESGLSSSVIGWWATFPAEPIHGTIVSERALKTREDDIAAMMNKGSLSPRDPLRLTYPADILEVIVDAFGRRPERKGPTSEEQRIKNNMRDEDVVGVETLLELREKFDRFDLELLLMRGVDPISHFFWRYHEPDAAAYTAEQRPGLDEVIRLGDTVQEHYRWVDGLLARLLVDDPERVVLIVSDHGFEAGAQPFRDGMTLSGTHQTVAARDGIFIASGGPIRKGEVIEEISIYDIAPLVVHLLGLPVSAEFEGHLRTELFETKWLEKRPPIAIERYDVPVNTLPPDVDPSAVSPLDDKLREELKALGYIE